MSEKIKVAIIGCGAIANSAHIPAYMKNEKAEIKYFCDIIPERAEAAVEKYGCGKPGCTVGCDCDRYMEVWNNVFSQFDNDGHGNYTELAQKNIDTGMGLERLAVVCQDVDSLFDVDTVMNITHKVTELTGATYGQSVKMDVSLRVITDHIRASTFMIADGVLPSNEGRGYVLRRLIRRALPAMASFWASTTPSSIRSWRPWWRKTRFTTPICGSAATISPRL